MTLTLTKAFAEFGLASRNIRSMSWSARKGGKVALALPFWAFDENFVYDEFNLARVSREPTEEGKEPGDPNWLSKQANAERKADIAAALQQNGGIVHVIFVFFKDAEKQHVRNAVATRMMLQITDFDEYTGRFRAEPA